MATKAKRPSPVRFFFANAGWSYDPKKQSPMQGRWETARKLAAAEAWARDNGIRFQWHEDPDADRSGIRHHSPLWVCTAHDESGECGMSCGIDLGTDGDPWTYGTVGGGSTYARVCEAELAVEVQSGAI